MSLQDTCSTTPIKCLLILIGIIVITSGISIPISINHDKMYQIIECNCTNIIPPCCIKDNEVVHCNYIIPEIITMHSMLLIIMIMLIFVIIVFCPPPRKKWNIIK